MPFHLPGDLPDAGIKSASPVSPALQEDSLPTEPSKKPLIVLFYYFPFVSLTFFLSAGIIKSPAVLASMS